MKINLIWKLENFLSKWVSLLYVKFNRLKASSDTLSSLRLLEEPPGRVADRLKYARSFTQGRSRHHRPEHTCVSALILPPFRRLFA